MDMFPFPVLFTVIVDVDINGLGSNLETKEKRDKKQSHCCHNSLKEPKSHYRASIIVFLNLSRLDPFGTNANANIVSINHFSLN